MFAINEDKSIYVTRGDVVFFSVGAHKGAEKYTFKAGDVVRMKVTAKKACDEVLLQKDFAAEDGAETVSIFLSEQDTKLGEVISKPTDYWYEIELNPNAGAQTIIGYDEDGAKILKLFPEGADVPPYDPSEEEIPVVDTELSLTSDRPIQNQAVARAVVRLDESIEHASAEFNETAERIQLEMDDVRRHCLSGEDAQLSRLHEVAAAAVTEYGTYIEADLNRRFDTLSVNVQSALYTVLKMEIMTDVLGRMEAEGTKVIDFDDIHIAANRWAADADGGYSVTVALPGILATDKPIADVALGYDEQENMALEEAWDCIKRVITYNGQIKLWGHVETLPSNIACKIRVVR